MNIVGPPGDAGGTGALRTADKQIADILLRYGEPFGGNGWRVQGTAVIDHRTLEGIAAQAGIRFDPPTLVRAERDEAVILVTGRLPGAKAGTERVEWSIGEALVDVNDRVAAEEARPPSVQIAFIRSPTPFEGDGGGWTRNFPGRSRRSGRTVPG